MPSPRALALVVLLGLPAPAQEGARAQGNELRERLRAGGVRQELAGTTRLDVRLGHVVVGSLVLETKVVAREDGEQVYRIQDRLAISLPGQGAARLLLAADLRADLSTVEARFESEQPRGVGQLEARSLTLFRRGERWVRRVEGPGAPVEEELEADLPADVLVVAPPLGAGERLVRAVPATLGLRLSLRALDLESGKGATWRCSVEAEPELSLADGTKRPGLALVRDECAASLETWREREGGAPWRFASGSRLSFARRELERVDPDPPGPARTVLRLLRAAAARDREGLKEVLDVEALLAAAGDPQEPSVRTRFVEALLDLLTDPGWLSRTQLELAVQGSRASDLEVKAGPDGAEVGVVGHPGLVFKLRERSEGWRVVDLPR